MSKARDLASLPVGGYDVNFYEDTGTTPKFFWDASAEKLGIGTSSPASKLSVSGGAGVATDIDYSGGIATGAEYSALRFTASGQGFVPAEIRGVNTNGGQNLGVMQMFTSGTERMRIDSSGNVGIGTSSPTVHLDLERAYSGSSAIRTNTTTSGTAYVPIEFRHNGSLVGYIASSTTSTSYITSSDYRLKENVVDLTGATDRLKQLNVHRFNFKANTNETVDGFLAHEVQAVVPEAATGTKDEVDGEGNPVYQGIDQSKLVPLLTAALQEALTKIESLETRIDALEGN